MYCIFCTSTSKYRRYKRSNTMKIALFTTVKKSHIKQSNLSLILSPSLNPRSRYPNVIIAPRANSRTMALSPSCPRLSPQHSAPTSNSLQRQRLHIPRCVYVYISHYPMVSLIDIATLIASMFWGHVFSVVEIETGILGKTNTQQSAKWTRRGVNSTTKK